MATRGGDVTADLQAILAEHCPDIADEVVAAYRVALAAAGDVVGGPGGGGASPAEGGTGAGGGADDGGTGPRWSTFTLGQIPGVEEVLTVAAAPLEAVAALLRVVAGLLDVLTAFLLEIPDPIRAMILAAYRILKEIVDDLLSSGAYVYSDVPGLTSWKSTLADLGQAVREPDSWKAGDAVAPAPTVGAFEGWASTFRRSFDDPGDGHRPIFSEGATVEAVFIMATAPKMVDIVPLLRMIATLLDDRKLIQALEAFPDADLPGFEDWLHPDPDDWRVRGRPTGPNWKSWKLRDVAPPDYPLRQLERVPELLLAILANIDSIVGLLKDLIKAIRSKIDVLLEIAEMLQRIIEMIKALGASGLHMLAVVTHDGVDGLVEAFLSATDRPGRRPDGTEVPGLVIGGACVLAGTSTGLYAAGPAMVWKLLGVDGPLDDARAALAADVQRHRDALEAAGKPALAAWDRMKEGAKTHAATFEAEIQRQDTQLEEALEDLAGLSISPADLMGAVRGARSEVMRQVEQLHGGGGPLDPLVLAELEAYRAARSRGRRSLAARERERP